MTDDLTLPLPEPLPEKDRPGESVYVPPGSVVGLKLSYTSEETARIFASQPRTTRKEKIEQMNRSLGRNL